MTVGTICNYNVATIGARQGVIEAAVLMRHEHVGDLIVVDEKNGRTVPIGIITDRDLVLGLVAERVPLDAVTVGDAMTREPLTVRKSNSIAFALREMRRAGVRRAPVVDDDGALVGVVSMDDVIDHVAAQLGYVAGLIRRAERAEAKARP